MGAIPRQRPRREEPRVGLRKFCRDHFLSFRRMKEWRDVHGQIREIVQEEAAPPGGRGVSLKKPAPAISRPGTAGFTARC